MAATKADAPGAIPALNFDAIERRAEEMNIESLADFLGVDRTTIWRWKNGLTIPSLDVADYVACRLGLPLDVVRMRRGATHTPPPSGPSTPPPPPAPRPGSPSRTGGQK